jgi:lysylphosphatidylglycerol synthetase-like protein (DUF2156 family)
MSQLTTGVRESATGTSARVRALGWGLAALVVAIAVDIYGAYGDPHPKTSQENGVPFIGVVVAVIAIAIFGFLVPAALRGMATRTRRWAGTALAMGILGVVLVPFASWSGLPAVIGAAAALLGLAGRDVARNGGRALATWSVALGTVAAVASIAFTILGNTVLAN